MGRASFVEDGTPEAEWPTRTDQPPDEDEQDANTQSDPGSDRTMKAEPSENAAPPRRRER
jgi:hypothetical protein